MRGLERKVLAPWLLAGFSSALALTVIAAGVQMVLQVFSVALTGVLLISLTALFEAYVLLKHGNWSFELREDYLYLEHGVLKKVETKVPYVRVQHVDTQRGPVYRVFGLSKLVVYTAGSRGADVGIPGLLPEDAEQIQEKLRKVAVESEEEFGDAV